MKCALFVSRLLAAALLLWQSHAANRVLAAVNGIGSAWTDVSGPFRPERKRATYSFETPWSGRESRIERLTLEFGPIETRASGRTQWLHLTGMKPGGTGFQIWLLCHQYPSSSIREAGESVVRYVLKEGKAEPLEFQDRASGRAVLPGLGAWPYLLPQPIGEAETAGCWNRVKLLGHGFRLERVDALAEGVVPPSAQILRLRSDAFIGVPHNTKQVDDRRRFDGSDYPLIRLTREDYEAMIQAGMNCFNVDSEQRRWIERREVYYWGGGVADLPFPECLYRPNYLGPALFFDEPAVVTRDYVIRPRLKQEPGLARQLTPEIMLHAFRDHFAKARYEGGPTELMRGLAAREDVDLGDMNFLQQNLYTWETMISTGIYQLTEGGAAPPQAIVFEPPGHLGTRRTLPEMNMVYGCQIPSDNPANLTSILYGLLCGAARGSGRDWGVSIYGAVDRADSPWMLTRAYDLGARWFMYWDTAGLACVPFTECLNLSRHLRDHIESCPPRDLKALRTAAETLILFPPGYNLGHVHMGKGSLWGLGELNLERTNQFGTTYRTVMHNVFTEIERSIRLGASFDLVWDIPGLSTAGYREVVRVQEDGRVEIHKDGVRLLQDGPREPQRGGGVGPRIALAATAAKDASFVRVTAVADITKGTSPVFYTPRPNREGVFENAVVFWELFGPKPEEYRALLGDGTQLQVEDRGATARATVTFRIKEPGVYRLRAAVADGAGRSAVAWQNMSVED